MNSSIVDRMKEAAYEREVNAQRERRAVEEIVLSAYDRQHGRSRLGETVKLGDDWAVEVVRGNESTWTTVVGGERSMDHWYTQEQALLHLIARRYNTGSGTNGAAFYAMRVLGVPTAGLE